MHDRRRGPRLRLGLGQVVAVEVEAVAVRARAGDAPVRVLDRVEDDHGLVEDLVDLGVGARGRRCELLDQLHRRIHALVLVAVDAALDEDRHLHRAVRTRQQRLRAGRVCQRDAADLLPVVESLAPLVRVEGVDRDPEHLAAERGRAGRLDRHPPTAPRCDRVERAADRVVRDVGKLPTGWDGSLPSGSAAAASVSGVPHQGGAIAALPVLEPSPTARPRAARTSPIVRIMAAPSSLLGSLGRS